jgi:glycine hydroxymethyltransferase
MDYLSQVDPQLKSLIDNESSRLENTLNLIAAENHAPESINEVLGSVLNTKTIEGYPGNRFHAGCSMVDEIEKLAIERGKELFNAEYINVQPHSGTSANLAVYFSVLNPGDSILSMSLPSGGHLSHGHRASITSKCFKFTHYTLDPETERIDYDQINELAKTQKPRMIVAGASAYPRLIDYKRMSKIAADIGAFFLTDMAHLAGLVAAKVIESPVPFSDFVTFTCYKTMMGGRGGIILCKEKFGKKIDSAIFPGCQGTSAVNLIAAKALIFKLAEKDNFVTIQKATINNAKKMAKAFMDKGYRVVTGGTDNHQVLVDLSSTNLSGKAAETMLEQVGIVLNRNVIPKDACHPGNVSGIRIGTGAVSARGMKAPESTEIVALIDATLKNSYTTETLSIVRSRVADLCRRFPIVKSL